MCNFADENTKYSCGDSFDSVVSTIEDDMSQAISWFKAYYMVANSSEFQVMLIGLKTNDSVLLILFGYPLLLITVSSYWGLP